MWAGSFHESIDGIEHPCCVGCADCVAEPPGRLECFEKRDEGRATNEILMSDSDEMPVVGTLVGSQSREQSVDHWIVERDEGEAGIDVEFGDKTCRGPAEPSTLRVDESSPGKVGHDHSLLSSVLTGGGSPVEGVPARTQLRTTGHDARSAACGARQPRGAARCFSRHAHDHGSGLG